MISHLFPSNADRHLSSGARLERLTLLAVFVLFAVIRIFWDRTHFLIAWDGASYLTLARNFPSHTVYFDFFYTLHPPLYPYFIWLFHFIGGYIKGALLLSLVSSLATFYLFYALMTKAKVDWLVKNIALLFCSIIPLHIQHSQSIYKESFMLTIFIAVLYFYFSGLLGKARSLYMASFLGIAAAYTSDFVLLLMLVMTGMLVATAIKDKRIIPRNIIPLASTAAAYISWLLTRYFHYRKYPLQPGGLDGLLEDTSRISLAAIFNPNFLPQTAVLQKFHLTKDWLSHLLPNLFYIFNPLSQQGPRALFLVRNYILFCLFIACLIAFIYSIYQSRRVNPKLWLLGTSILMLFVVFLVPLPMQSFRPRYSLPSAIAGAYIWGSGLIILARLAVNLAQRIKSDDGFSPQLARSLQGVIALASLALALIWYQEHRYPVLASTAELESANTAAYINTLPPGNIMAQPGYPLELIYQTGRNIIGLPADPSLLEEQVRAFDIKYIVFGNHYWDIIRPENRDRIYCYDTIIHIMSHEERFRRLQAIYEEYRSLLWPDLIFIYQVENEML